jgi:hypothetical protein
MQISVPKSNWGRFSYYFCMQFVSYALLVANGRAYVQGSYGWTALTDSLIATQNFLVIRRMAKESDDELHGLSMLGYILGGTLGSVTSIFVTKILYGQ